MQLRPQTAPWQPLWQLGGKTQLQLHNVSPLEEEEVEVVVLLSEEVSKDASGVATADLIRRQCEVDALDEVPQLGHKVLAKHPAQMKRKE